MHLSRPQSARAAAAFCMPLVAIVFSFASANEPPELTLLQLQFEKLVTDRVTSVYNDGLARLNASYLASIESSVSGAKAAGDLEAVLSLEAEKKRVAGNGALPANDAETNAALKKLRGIYRAQLAKLETQRVSNLAPLFPAHIARVKQLEVDLTKADRLPEAKAVMDYRLGLAVEAARLASANSALPQAIKLPIGTRLAENVKIFASGCPNGCIITINGKELMTVIREVPGEASTRLREGDVIAVNVPSKRFDINSFWLSCISSKGEFLFETSLQWMGYLPEDEAKWWDIKAVKEQKPVEFALDRQEYVDRMKNSAARTPLYSGTSPIRSMVSDGIHAGFLYYVISKADLVPKPDRKLPNK